MPQNTEMWKRLASAHESSTSTLQELLQFNRRNTCETVEQCHDFMEHMYDTLHTGANADGVKLTREMKREVDRYYTRAYNSISSLAGRDTDSEEGMDDEEAVDDEDAMDEQ